MEIIAVGMGGACDCNTYCDDDTDSNCGTEHLCSANTDIDDPDCCNAQYY